MSSHPSLGPAETSILQSETHLNSDDASQDAQRTITVEIFRGTAEDGQYQSFTVPRRDNQTVLDIVSWVQHYADPSLSYRFACRVGMCGSCAMMVNDEPRWTCRTHIDKVVQNDRLKIAPLRNLPVIKDLVADLKPFFDKWVAAEARHHPKAGRHDKMAAIKPTEPARQQADAGIECINCAVCYAACDTVAGQADYLGPAALQRAWTVLNDARDADRNAVLDAVSGHNGCHNCHSMGSCSAYCPNELKPMDAIAGLKRETSKRAWQQLFTPTSRNGDS